MNKAFEKILDRLEELRETYNEMAFVEMNTNGHTLDFEYAKGKKDVMLDVKQIVQEVAEEYNNGWIACSERLPEKYNRVLAHTDAGGYYIAHVNGCGKFVCTAECVSTVIENSDVIAWQPLPDPYQPVSNDSTDAGTRYEKSAWRDLILRNFMRGSDA